MPSPINIKIPCQEYLIKFMINLYGPMPIEFVQKDNLAKRLDFLLSKPPKNFYEDSNYDGMLIISLPWSRDKDPRVYNYLSKMAQKCFIDKVKDYFQMIFIDEINKSRLEGINRKDSIIIFIEKFELPATSDMFERLDKYYQRYIDLKRVRTFRKKQKSKCKISQ